MIVGFFLVRAHPVCRVGRGRTEGVREGKRRERRGGEERETGQAQRDMAAENENERKGAEQRKTERCEREERRRRE